MTSLHILLAAVFLGTGSLRSRRREAIGRKGKRERDWGERVRDACYKDPFLFISKDAGVRKFLIG